MHIKNIYRLHKDEIEALVSEEEKFDRLVELNVLEQVSRLTHTLSVQEAWKTTKKPVIHGCVYRLSDGLIKKLVTVDEKTPIDPIYEYDFT
jgi:carbonic anhydrase